MSFAAHLAASGVGCIAWLGGVVMCTPRSSLQEMVQLFFPSLHESLIIIGCECGHELVARGTHASVAVSNIRKATITITIGKLNLQPTGRHSGHDLQHLDKPSCRLVTCDIPNRLAQFVGRDEDAIALGNPGGTDDQIW